MLHLIQASPDKEPPGYSQWTPQATTQKPTLLVSRSTKLPTKPKEKVRLPSVVQAGKSETVDPVADLPEAAKPPPRPAKTIVLDDNQKMVYKDTMRQMDTIGCSSTFVDMPLSRSKIRLFISKIANPGK